MVTVEKRGRRYYLVGMPYYDPDLVDAYQFFGMHLDRAGQWWSGKKEYAEVSAAYNNGHTTAMYAHRLGLQLESPAFIVADYARENGQESIANRICKEFGYA